MPEYLATVRRADGRKVTENVFATSADEAMRLLRERGCDDVVLHSDDIGALFTRQREKAEHISPGDYLLIRNLPRGLGFFLVVTLQGYRTMGPVMVGMALALAFLGYTGLPLVYWGWLTAAILIFPPGFSLVATLFGRRTARRYRQMIDALYWGLWEESLRLAHLVGPKVSPHEVAFRKAMALAGMDRLDEALELVEPYGDGKAIPVWLYRSLLAQVYEFARLHGEATALREQSVELAPDNAALILGLGTNVIWRTRDARRARGLLDRAREHALSDMVAPFATLLEGLILLEEGRPREALPVLEAAYTVFHARKGMALGYLPVEQAMLGRALTHAALGEGDEALKLYGKVRPRLVALRSERLDRSDRAIGLPQGG